MEHYKMSNFLENSAVSKFVARKLADVNDLLGGQ